MQLKAEAQRLGFSLVGIAAATDADTFPQFETWLDEGHAGAMEYLPRHRDARRHPRSILPAVASVVMLGLEYATPDDPPEAAPTLGKVARYARGTDYHTLIWERLNLLAHWLHDAIPGTESRGVTDTAPLLERDFARRAGIGWFGKNTMLINRQRGSFYFLGALLTSATLTPDRPFTANHCGSCRACLDSCPTQAFVKPGVLDARKCISYLTIELRQEIPLELRESMGNWIWGCDICQEVCPWNRFSGQSEPGFPVDASLTSLDPREILRMNEDEFRQRFRHTAIWRNKRRGLQRNAAIVLGNTGELGDITLLQQIVAKNEPLVATTAQWAIEQIQNRARTPANA